jgi:hypothetical protein
LRHRRSDRVKVLPFFTSDGTVLINPASVAYIAESFY